MVKKTMILADSDEAYLERLSNYFMEKSPQLELNIFTDRYLLRKYLENAKADILVVGESFADSEMALLTNVSVKLILSSGNSLVEGFEPVRKYQKTESLLNEILLKYAEKTGSSETIKGNCHTRVAAFYSPAGGTGKSVLSLGMAVSSASAGLKTLYLNLEEVDSIRYILEKTPGSLSDLFLSLKTKGMNVGIKLASSAAKETAGGFYYVSGVESVSEYEEMNSNDMVHFLEIIKELAEYEVIVLDLSSGFYERTVEILKQADRIFVPVTADENAILKVRRLLDEAQLHDTYSSIFEKMSLVVNRSLSGGPGKELVESGLLGQMQCAGVIGETALFTRKASLIQAGAKLMQWYQPLLDCLLNQ